MIGVLVHFLPINYFDDWYYHLAGGLMAVCVTIIFLAMGVSISCDSSNAHGSRTIAPTPYHTSFN
ncbi:hypothetical protein ACR31S_00230 [Streptococcus iniae]